MSIEIKHNAGFFSCCSVRLNNIVDYINNNKRLPEKVDSSKQFMMYKTNKRDDITYDFFEKPENRKYEYTNYIDYNHDYQFIEYSKLNYENIKPIINIYFEPSERIKTVINNIITTYNICYERCVSVYYRGTDKCIETGIDSFDSFNNKLTELLMTINDNDIQILIQSDSAQFIDYITTKNNKYNLIIINELSASYTNKGSHHERTRKQNYNDITNLLSIISIISKCKYIICSSGNVSIWTMLYRGNYENVYQSLNLKWL
jgi:hypothetical protein